MWRAKPALRAVYEDYYRRMAHWRQPGPTVEVGAGSGNLRERLPDVIATDIVPCAWIDAVVDAEALPFAGGSLANVVSTSCTTSSTRGASSPRSAGSCDRAAVWSSRTGGVVRTR